MSAYHALHLSLSGAGSSAECPCWVIWLRYRLLPLPGDVLDLQVFHAPQIDPVSPAVVGEPDKGVVAARAANDGAKPPHLVDHRRPDLIGPSAALAGVTRGGCLEGEDLPEGAGRGVAVQPEFVHSPLTSCGSEAFGLHPSGAVAQAHQRRPS